MRFPPHPRHVAGIAFLLLLSAAALGAQGIYTPRGIPAAPTTYGVAFAGVDGHGTGFLNLNADGTVQGSRTFFHEGRRIEQTLAGTWDASRDGRGVARITADPPLPPFCPMGAGFCYLYEADEEIHFVLVAEGKTILFTQVVPFTTDDGRTGDRAYLGQAAFRSGAGPGSSAFAVNPFGR